VEKPPTSIERIRGEGVSRVAQSRPGGDKGAILIIAFFLGVGDLSSTRSGDASRVGTTEVVHRHGVEPEGLDRGVGVEHTLHSKTIQHNQIPMKGVSYERPITVTTCNLIAGGTRHVVHLVVTEPALSNVGVGDMGNT
jgi:hypothetical protein